MTDGSTRHPHLLTAGAIGATIVAGVGVASQHRVNGELGQVLDDGFTAALLSFTIGLVLVVATALALPSGRLGLRRVPQQLRTGELRWWMLLGGLGGAVLVLGQGLVAGILGVAVYTVATVTGQTIMGLVLDAIGFAGAPRKPVTIARVVGASLTVAAVVVAVAPELGGSIPVLALLLPLVAGLGIGTQQALNGRVRTATRSAAAATTVNFVVGTSALAVATAVHLLLVGLPQQLPSNPALYLGGVLGAAFIAIQVVTVARIGVLLLGLCLVAGQLLGALVFGLVIPIGVPTTGWTALAVGLTLGGVAIAAQPWRARAALRAARSASASPGSSGRAPD